MATTAFSGHSISLAATPPAAAVAPSRPALASALPRRNPNSNPGCSARCLTASRPIPIARKRRGTPRAGSDPEVTDLNNDGQVGQDSSGDTSYTSLNMQGLIQLYKEAIANGDEKGIADLEAAICKVEQEKNELLNKVTEITAEIASGKDNFLLLNADFENFRKRSDKDRLRFTSDIQGETIESLLPLVDNFEKAKQQVVPETEKEKKIVTSYQGIYKQFVEIMRGLRVSVVETVGKQFDPSLHMVSRAGIRGIGCIWTKIWGCASISKKVHEAVGRVDSDQFREGTVLQEVQRGFLLGDSVLRPAKVKVSSGPSTTTAAPDDEKTAEKSSDVAESDNEELSVAEGS